MSIQRSYAKYRDWTVKLNTALMLKLRRRGTFTSTSPYAFMAWFLSRGTTLPLHILRSVKCDGTEESHSSEARDLLRTSVALQALRNLARLSSRRWQSFPTAPDGTGLTCGQHIESHSCIFSFPNRIVTSLFK
jgi:hypothetical protein